MHLFACSKCVISLLYVQSNGERIFAFLDTSIDAYLASMRLAVTFGDELTLAVCAHIYSLRIRTISNASADHDREYTPFYTDNTTPTLHTITLAHIPERHYLACVPTLSNKRAASDSTQPEDNDTHTRPSKRQAKQVVAVRFLDKTAAALYQDFTHENPTMPISKSQFYKIAPPQCKRARRETGMADNYLITWAFIHILSDLCPKCEEGKNALAEAKKLDDAAQPHPAQLTRLITAYEGHKMQKNARREEYKRQVQCWCILCV